MRGKLVRNKWEIEELIKIISENYGVTESRARHYFIVLGMLLFLKTGIKEKRAMSWKKIREMEKEIREELGRVDY